MTKENGMPLEGEGSYIGGKKYQDAQHKFAQSGKVKEKAREAAEALNSDEAKDLEAARKQAARGETKSAKTRASDKS